LQYLSDEFFLLSCASPRKDCFKDLNEACLDESLVKLLVGVYIEESIDGLSSPLFQFQVRDIDDEIFQYLSNTTIFFIRNCILLGVEMG
jgi:hypothetical protein